VDQATNRPPPFTRGRTLTVWGVNLGPSAGAATVWLDERRAEITERTPYTVSFKLPIDASPKTTVSVEVNGCRGNAYAVETR